MAYREAFEHIQSNYMLRLSEAGFPTSDALLVPAAGACNACPKRTGNQRELFDDVKSADVCTDPVCFLTKRRAALMRRVEAVRTETGIDPLFVATVFGYSGNDQKQWPAGTLDRSAFKEVKPESCKSVKPAVVAAADQVGDLGKTLYVCTNKRCPKHGASTSSSRPRSSSSGSRPSTSAADSKKFQEQQRKAAEARRTSEMVRLAGLARVAAAAEKRELGDKDLRLIASVLLVEVNNVCEIAEGALHHMAVRRELMQPDPKGNVYALDRKAEAAFRAALPKVSGKELRGLVMELLVASMPERGSDGGPTFVDAFTFFGVDLKRLAAASVVRRCRECGCTEVNACVVMGEGCAWLEQPDPKTGLGLCTAPACAKKHVAAKPAKKGKGRK